MSNKILRKSSKHANIDTVFDIFNVILLCVIALCVAYPLYFVLIASFSDPDAVNAGKVFIVPFDFTLDGYKQLLQEDSLWLGYGNTIFYTVCGTTLNVVLTLITAYPLSRKDFAGRQLFLFYFMFTMFFNGGLIPTYLTVSGYGLYNTRFVLVVLGAISIYNLIIARSFFENSIPSELKEAAELDGCGNFAFFISIVIPLSKAIIGVLTIYYAVGHWNQYFNALIYVAKANLQPLQMVLREILLQNSSVDAGSLSEVALADYYEQQRYAQMIKYGTIVVASLPMLCAYPFVQKYFAKGVMIGSVKG